MGNSDVRSGRWKRGRTMYIHRRTGRQTEFILALFALSADFFRGLISRADSVFPPSAPSAYLRCLHPKSSCRFWHPHPRFSYLKNKYSGERFEPASSAEGWLFHYCVIPPRGGFFATLLPDEHEPVAGIEHAAARHSGPCMICRQCPVPCREAGGHRRGRLDPPDLGAASRHLEGSYQYDRVDFPERNQQLHAHIGRYRRTPALPRIDHCTVHCTVLVKYTYTFNFGM